MIGWIKKRWHDPVWSNVFGTAVFALLAAVGTYFFDWWPNISRAFKELLKFSLSTSAISNWLLMVLVVPWLLILTIFVFRFVNWRKHSKIPPASNWRNYTTDNFFDIKWGWKFDEAGQVLGLYSLCPHCDYQIYAKPNFAWGADKTEFYCENCCSNLGSHKDEMPQIENKVIRHIQRKLRTGEWHNSKNKTS